MIHILDIAGIKLRAPLRRSGYVKACFERGKLSKDKKMLEFTEEVFQSLRRDFALRGAGDLVQAGLDQIPLLSTLPCHDKATGDLKPESGCAKRRDLMNEFLPFKNGGRTAT